MTTTYTTRNEAVLREIIEPLGEYAEEYDADAIADEVLFWHDEIREDGSTWLPGCGFRLNPDVDFWGTVEANTL